MNSIKSKGLTIADTLSDSWYKPNHFWTNANRPVIRGMDKFGFACFKMARTPLMFHQSEDHAVPIDPLMVDRIEVLRGSSALLHGGSAIGGVVNVIDRSIPTSPYADSSGASAYFQLQQRE